MIFKSVKLLVLNALCDFSQEDPCVLKDISDIVNESGVNPVEIAEYLKDYKLVKNVQIKQEKFYAQITFKGIYEINPIFIKVKKESAISFLGKNGKSDLMEILEFKNLDNAKDFAIYLESINMIKLFDCTANEIMADLSVEGRVYYQSIKSFSLNL